MPELWKKHLAASCKEVTILAPNLGAPSPGGYGDIASFPPSVDNIMSAYGYVWSCVQADLGAKYVPGLRMSEIPKT